MDRRKLVRSFIFSSEKHKTLIESLLLRCAEAEGRSVSAIIEDAVIDYMVVRYPGSYPVDELLKLRRTGYKEDDSV